MEWSHGVEWSGVWSGVEFQLWSGVEWSSSFGVKSIKSKDCIFLYWTCIMTK